MTFKVIWDTATAKDFRRINVSEAQRIIKKVEAVLSKNSRAGIALKGNFAGLYRYRVGDYRVIYEIREKELVIIIVKVGHRKDIYHDSH
jgi:mRNA interferase RelE/StbE